MTKKEDELKKKKNKDLMFGIIITLFIFLIFAIGLILGFYAGVQYTTQTFFKGMGILFSSSDVHISMNMSINETKMVDYMWEKARGTELTNDTVEVEKQIINQSS